jgi:hypothetical protein
VKARWGTFDAHDDQNDVETIAQFLFVLISKLQVVQAMILVVSVDRVSAR